VGDLGGGVKAQGSGDAGTAGQAQAGQTSQARLPRTRAEQPIRAFSKMIAEEVPAK
jgi:hypothetical protein